jgi:hypothetical protein
MNRRALMTLINDCFTRRAGFFVASLVTAESLIGWAFANRPGLRFAICGLPVPHWQTANANANLWLCL